MGRSAPPDATVVTPAGLRSIARVLRRHRYAVALCLKDSIAGWDKYSGTIANTGVEAFVAWETIPLTDYLIGFFRTDDSHWRDIYLGERLKQLHWVADTLDQIIERRERVFQADRDALQHLLQPHLPAHLLREFDQRFERMQRLVTDGARGSREVKILFIGDCLYLDLYVFLSPPLAECGITLRPVYATSKNPSELRARLAEFPPNAFDLVCYSPYTYGFSVLLEQTHYARVIFSSPGALRHRAAQAHKQIAPTLRLLSDHFDCTVIVQNTANIRRHNSTPFSYAKSLTTWVTRHIAGRQASALLAQEIAEINGLAPIPMMLLDERAVVAREGELSVAKKFYDSEPQHPTALALKLAEVYSEAIYAATFLVGKKVVVVDLDNTVWAGIIGEGAVEHNHRRQRVLQQLRKKGVLLAIASKNDPRNVHWTGGSLTEQDFVAAEINWDPKPITIRRIAEQLNLGLKDFVFVEDRPDEREMVRLGLPGILCLDATLEATWRMFDWWAAALPEQSEADRTQLYAERKLRQSYLDEIAATEDQESLLSSLGLRLEIRRASRKELRRATDLINRTNQFNTAGSRATAQQVAAWHESPNHTILVAEAADKFGTMGIVSVMVLERVGDALEIPVWVLSCRVFGFGIETAMLNQARRIARQLGVAGIRSYFVETPNNQPCREVYAIHGFTWTGTLWELVKLDVPPDPAWLKITPMDDIALPTRS